MATATIQVAYEAETSSLKATVNEINQINDKVVEGAQKAAKQSADAFKKVGESITGAFAGENVKKALNNINLESLKLVKILPKVTTEVKLLANTADEVAKLEDQLRELALAGKTNTAEFDKIAKAVGTYKSAITSADRAVEAYAKSTDAASSRIGILEDKLYDLAIAGQQDTQEFKDLIQETTRLKKAIFETDQQVDSFVERGRGLNTVVQNVQLVGLAFQAVEGISAAFGAENEELQKTLVKLNAVMAITGALEQARAILLEQSAKKTGIAAIAQSGYNVVVGTSTGLLKGLRIALAATGVGALAFGLIALVQNFDNVKKAISNAVPGFADVAEGVGKVIDKTKEFFGLDNNAAKTKLALDNLIGAENRKTEFQVAEIDRRINKLKAENKDTSALEREKEQIQINSLKAQRNAVKDGTDQLLKLDIEGRKEVREQARAIDAEILDRENELQVARIEIATKAVQDRLTVELNGLKIVELIDGESVANKEAQLRKQAEIEKTSARQTIQNVQVRASAIKLIEAQLGLDIAQINLDAQNKIIENEVKLIEAKKIRGTATIEEEIKQLNLSFTAEKNSLEAKIKLNQASNADLELLTANHEKNIKDITNAARQEQFNLRVQAFELNKTLGATSLADELKLIRARAEAELKANEDSNKSFNQKEADRKAIIARTDAEITQTKVTEANKRIDIDNAEAQAAVTLGTSTYEQRVKLIEDEGTKAKNALDKKLIGEKAYNAEIIKINADTTAKLNAEQQARIDKIFEFAQAASSAFAALNELSQVATQIRLEEIQSTSDKELEAINNSSQLERDKVTSRIALEKKKAAQIAEINRKQAVQDKALAVFNIGISTAEAIMKFLVKPGGPEGIALSILAGITGAAQAAAVLAKPIPKFERGGLIGGRLHSQGGTLIEAEQGEYMVNRRQSAKHRRELDAMNTSTEAFRRMIDEKYVRPALMSYSAGRRSKEGVVVNASLNSKSMEKKLDTINKSLKNRNVVVNINQQDSRYLWQ